MLFTSLAMLFQVLLKLHVVAGFTALLVFWIPMVTKKGGKVHSRVGWVYVVAMGLVAVTAVYLGAWRIWLDPEQTDETVAFAYFLLFIAVLSWASCWFGLRVLRFKQRKVLHKQAIDVLTSLALLLGGIATSIYGFKVGIPLLQWFPVIGIVIGAQQVYYWLTPPRTKLHWWFEHLGSMLGCCIATITAFTVFGAPRLLQLEEVPLIVWFIPTILLTPVIVGYNIYYRLKFRQA
ncbi:DUF2306 domain-containing protein [Paenibacillus sp. YYML68]|uniref:DUF2306 domain-containing protein n=1 Tax=Paenibacillus sp. YYML68 TaxID=2909250 RepID=UPI0024934A4F|nr:DUF2306 domain-containing protein [Paenibacillus sp. YYML68]